MSMTSDELRTRNLRTVAALAGLFLLPLIVSFWLYYATDWRPAGSTAHGELISPPRPLPATPALVADKWTLVYIGDGQCDESCRRALLVMRQTRLALNNEMTRVNRVFLTTAHCCDEEFLRREHQGLIVADASAELLRHFPEQNRAEKLFVVDPLGNLMMRYDARQNPKGLLQDLKKLLKLSHIG
jgi:hypothetical protein